VSRATGYKENLSEQEALFEVEESCRAKDISGWEIFLLKERSLGIEAKDEKVDSLIRAEHSGMALRIFSRNRVGFAYATDLRPASLGAMAEHAAASAREVTPDPLWEVTPPGPDGIPDLDVVDPGINGIPEAQKIARALALEKGALSFDPRIRRVRSAEYEEFDEEVYLKNSLGLDLHGRRTLFSISLIAVAEQEEEAQTGFEFDFSYKYDKLDPEEIGALAAAKAVGLLGARPTSTGSFPVVLIPEASAELVGVLASAFSAEAVCKGRSWLKDKLGKAVFASGVNIKDSGLCLQGEGAFPFDGEGTPSQETQMVESGRLIGFLFDRYYARKMGCSSTGNCVRESIEGPPRIGPTNLYLEPGKGTTKELIKQVSSGMLVEELLGIHTADPITGEFSVGITGKRIERGQATHAVTGMAMAGTLEDFFQRVECLAGDLRFVGGFGSPGVLVGSVELSGI
jgi:PmbA protein